MRETLYTLSGIAVILAWITARQRAEHRAFAALLSLGLLSDIIVFALQRWVLPPPLVDSPPLTGWIRIAGDVDTALYVAWPAGIAAVALHTLAHRSPRAVLLAFLAIVAALVIGYPTIRGEVLRKTLLGIELAALLVGLASMVAWRGRRERFTVSTLCACVLVVGHFGTVISGPYRFGLFGEAWVLAQVAYLLIFAVVILLQGGSLWERRST